MKSIDQKILDQLLFDYEKTVARLVLFCLQEMSEPQGVRRTIDILKGTRSSAVVSHELNKLQTFSSLVGFTRDQLSDVLDKLIHQHFIEVEYVKEEDEEYAVLKITSDGLQYLQEPGTKRPGLTDILMDKDATTIPADDQDLYYKLKLTRRQLAEEYDIPAFMVCSDDVLADICIKKPMENKELEKINQLAPQFMDLYARDFLYVIRQYITREKGS